MKTVKQKKAKVKRNNRAYDLYLRGLSFREIAKIVGLSYQGVKDVVDEQREKVRIFEELVKMPLEKVQKKYGDELENLKTSQKSMIKWAVDIEEKLKKEVLASETKKEYKKILKVLREHIEIIKGLLKLKGLQAKAKGQT